MCRTELLPQVQLSSLEPSSGLLGDDNMGVRRTMPNERNVQLLAGDRGVGNLLRPPGMTADEMILSLPLRRPFVPEHVRIRWV